jgi:hypothetical protein
MGEPNLLALYYHKVDFWRLKTRKDCGKVFELSVVLETPIFRNKRNAYINPFPVTGCSSFRKPPVTIIHLSPMKKTLYY